MISPPIKDWHNELKDYIMLIGDDSDEAVILLDQLMIALQWKSYPISAFQLSGL